MNTEEKIEELEREVDEKQISYFNAHFFAKCFVLLIRIAWKIYMDIPPREQP